MDQEKIQTGSTCNISAESARAVNAPGSTLNAPVPVIVIESLTQYKQPPELETYDNVPDSDQDKSSDPTDDKFTLNPTSEPPSILQVREVADSSSAADPQSTPALVPSQGKSEDDEEHSEIESRSFEDPKLKELINVLIEWINEELAGQRIIVKDIKDDLYDGQVLQKLLEKLTDSRLDEVDVSQSEEGQKHKLKNVLDAVQKQLGQCSHNWTVNAIHSKSVVAILRLLVAMVRHFRAPVRLPENVVITVAVVQKRDGQLHSRTDVEQITSSYSDLGLVVERDAFETLFDQQSSDQFEDFKTSLVTFVNKHLSKVNLEVSDVESQFHDGVFLILLIGLLEGFFVPLYSYNLTPADIQHKVHNVTFFFELMMDVGFPKPKARAEDIVNGDVKSTLRVLYNLFTKYKHLC